MAMTPPFCGTGAVVAGEAVVVFELLFVDSLLLLESSPHAAATTMRAATDAAYRHSLVRACIFRPFDFPHAFPRHGDPIERLPAPI